MSEKGFRTGLLVLGFSFLVFLFLQNTLHKDNGRYVHLKMEESDYGVFDSKTGTTYELYHDKQKNTWNVIEFNLTANEAKEYPLKIRFMEQHPNEPWKDYQDNGPSPEK